MVGHRSFFAGVIMTAYARDYPGKIHALVYVHCTLDLKSALLSHINNGIKLLKEVDDTFTVNKELPAFDQMSKVHEELAKKGIEYKIMFRSRREKDIDDSLISSATPNFNQDFSHKVWAGLKDYWIDYSPYTKNIACPVLIIAGKKDYAVGPDSYRSWHFKNEKIILCDWGHVSFQEEPGWFANNVLQFLNNQ